MDSNLECPLSAWRGSMQPSLRRMACAVPVEDHVVIRDGDSWKSYGLPGDPFAHWIAKKNGQPRPLKPHSLTE